MASSKKYAILCLDGAGAPLTGLTPSWTAYWNLFDNSSDGSPPTITEVGGGIYVFDAALIADGARAGVIDCGATAAVVLVAGQSGGSARYAIWQGRYEDRNAAADVWGYATRELTGLDVGADVWGYGTRTLTALDGTPAADVWAATTRALTSSGDDAVATAVWAAVARTLTDFSDVWTAASRTLTASGVTAIWAAASRTLTAQSLSGLGAESVSVQFTDGSSGVQGALVLAINGSSELVAAQLTDGGGSVSLLLDAGAYTLLATRPGYQWAETAVTVSSPDTISTSTIAGSALTAGQFAQVGVTRSVSCSAKTRGARIENISQGDVLTLTRTVTGVPDGTTISSAVVRFGSFAEKRTDLSVAATVTDSGADGTGVITFALTAAYTRGFQPGQPTDYQLRVVLASGTEVLVEDGVIVVDPEID
ncbi:MAG TPA: hypothetical protein DCQ64_02350 [Candidatus Rokubacteria bacterium]|nr:hypothetical protein [Candidatus Rokubacteria bacterium]